MGFSMIGIVLMSELLVASVEAVTAILGLTPFFVGIIIVPIIGNVAEHLVAVQAARQNKMDLSLSISLGSSLQIALFVTPVLVFVSLLLGQSPYAAVQSAGADRSHGCVHDLSPGLFGWRVQLAGRSHAAGGVRHTGSGVLFLAFKALTNDEGEFRYLAARA